MFSTAQRSDVSPAILRIEKWNHMFWNYFMLSVGAFFMVMPFVWMLVTSVKPRSEILTYPPTFLVAHPTLESFADLFRLVPMKRYILNSLFVASSVTLANLLLCSMAGYAFAKHKFWGRDKIFMVLLGSMMIPWQVNIIPGFIFVKKLGWLNSYQGLIVPSMASAFGIFLMRQFMRSIPDDLLDSARIDGCSEFYIYRRIVLPLCKPALAVVAVLDFQNSWNDFLAPLVFLQDLDKKTVILGLANMLDVQTAERWDWIMAAAATATLPMLIVFYFAQSVLVKGVTLTGMRG